MKDKLIPIEQREILFNGSKITAVLVTHNHTESIYVPIRPLVLSLGLSWSGQRAKIKRDPILNEVCTSVRVTRTDVAMGAKTRAMLALPLDHLDGFLFKINANRVKPELRDKVIAYQKHCYRVLAEAFRNPDALRRYFGSLGHGQKWIGTRMKAFETKYILTDEWLERHVDDQYHEELSSQIDLAAFGMTTEAYKKHKGLKETDNLQDHMTNLELIFDMLADEAAIGQAIGDDARGYEANKQAAIDGGKKAGKTRAFYEKEMGKGVVTDSNYLAMQDKKRLAGDEEGSK